MDTFLQPVARAVVISVGTVGGIVLMVLGAWWWVPVPMLLGLLVTELVFHRRRDRPVQVLIEDHELRLVDPLLPAAVVVPLGGIRCATRFVRARADGEFEVAVALGDDEDVRFAFEVRCARAPRSVPTDVQVESVDQLFGGIAGIFRALAPGSRRPRQVLHDPEGALLAALDASLPRAVWSRTGIRLWPGMEPEIDLFGYYRSPHSDWMVLEQHGWARDGSSGDIGGWTVSLAERSAVLFQGLGVHQVERVRLVLLGLGSDCVVALPAPLRTDPVELQPLTSDLLHTHAPEGAALLWHLLAHTPRDRWPEALRGMITDASSHEGGPVVLPG